MSDINSLVTNSSIKDSYCEQKIRSLINSEYEAIRDYQNALYMMDKYPEAVKVITDIMNEEKVHVEELNNLLKKIDPYYNIAVKKAKEESK